MGIRTDNPLAHWRDDDWDWLWCALYRGLCGGTNTGRNGGTIVRHYCGVSERSKARFVYGTADAGEVTGE